MAQTIKYLFILIIVFLIAVLFYFLPTNILGRPQACIKSQCFNLEIAKTPEERAEGLMHRTSLKENSGMLFIFPNEGKHSFWMKKTLIPLDIIWINLNKQIVHIQHSATPCQSDSCPSLTPNKNAKYVLEINAGLAKEHSFIEGDIVTFKNLLQ